MIHGPCGHLNETNSCMIEGQCKSHYPRKFCKTTIQGEDSYPIYRRRDDSQTVDVRKAKLNNQWVVPYNPYLLLRYDCHMNVEICSGLTAVKYLYKYIYKGHDKVVVHIATVNAKSRTLLYVEFPEYYVWDNQTKSWYERKKRRVIGRVNAANPVEGERYYLRLLLSHVRGPISFDYLLMVNGKRYFTFKESAQKRGLLESDRSNFDCMNEAVTFQMPHALRRLFETILVYCEAADVRLLWDTYFEAMSDDLKRQFHHNREFLVSKTLQSLNLILESMGKKNGAFDLPRISLDMRQSNATFSREIEEEKSIQISYDDYLAQFKLNVAQHEAFEKIQECVNLGNGGLFFVNGPGGNGKAFLYRALLANIRKKKHDCPSYSHFRSCSFNITRWSNSSFSL
ncbi:uncharacterized protein [Henckelia pumila]|uniref:uncharacterized protein n=1 Tax=Henckelia pumila TaxID=405737 RepID=UPI003C6E1892